MTPGNSKPTSLSLRIALGLVLGLGLGLVASLSGRGWLMGLAVGIEPVGTVWINLIRMVVIPLVGAALISGAASLGDVRKLGRVGARTLAFIFGTELIGALLGLSIALLVVPLARLSPEATATLRETAAAQAGSVTETVQRIQGLRQFLIELVPTNPVKAAADGALLPIIVFSMLFGAATATLDERPRQAIVDLADAVVATLIKLIGWIMVLAPVGVLCLAAPVAARFGWRMLASLAVFVGAVVGAVIIFAVVVYGGATRFLVRIPMGHFARTIAPASTVGFTTASSMAALPAMMEIAIGKLGISPPVASFAVPVAATLNRPGSTIYQTIAAVFIASLYGVTLGPAQYAAILATVFLMTFSVVAVPASTVFTTAPVLLAAGLPVDGIALLLGVDRIPDMFRTGLNATGHVITAAVVARAEGEEIG